MENMPFFELEFDKRAKLVDPSEWQSIEQELKDQAYTDIIVLSHGWNNDINDAKDLYNGLLKLVQAELDQYAASNRKFMAIGVLWPSKKFADKELIPGGAAGLETNPNKAEVINECKKLQEFMDSKSKLIIQDIRKALEKDAEADDISKKFKNLLESIRGTESTNEDTMPSVDLNSLNMMLTDDGFWTEANERMGNDGVVPLSLWTGILGGVQNILNITTYYLMKNRSGEIGRIGLNPVIHKIKEIAPEVKIHLVGHSFGARLVSSAVMGERSGNEVEVDSLSLLQAAFSHYAFAKQFDGMQDGLFRSVLTKKLVKGPFLITHTHKDKAVGIAYAIASRIGSQVGQAIGDENDRYGGLGGNGAQKTNEALKRTLLASGEVYDFETGKVFNLNSDKYICGHSDIVKPEVAGALTSAFLT